MEDYKDYKLLIVFKGTGIDRAIRTISDIEQIILLSDSKTYCTIEGIKELKSEIWEMTFRATVKAVKTVCNNMLNNPNIEHYYISANR